jgi:hypothetical protein
MSEFSNNELILLQQGASLLFDKTTQNLTALVQIQIPGENNLDTVREYYTRRQAVIKGLEHKIAELLLTGEAVT